MPTLDNILAVILGGGFGKRLYPLTKQRSKPAVPIAGKYRLIDLPLRFSGSNGLGGAGINIELRWALDVLLDGAQLGGLDHRRQVFFRESGGDLDLQVDLSDHPG